MRFPELVCRLAWAYASFMNRIVIAFVLLWPVPAMAMNWEGHDDWMLDFEPALALMKAIPAARPLPSRDCPVTAEAAAKNHYEQIPLRRHNCVERPERDEPRR